MKRQKRDRLERAQSQGYKAGLNGRSQEACPYSQMDSRSYWLGGWRDAKDDKNAGLYKQIGRKEFKVKAPLLIETLEPCQFQTSAKLPRAIKYYSFAITSAFCWWI